MRTKLHSWRRFAVSMQQQIFSRTVFTRIQTILALVLFALTATSGAHAVTFKVLHSFTGTDGASASGNLIIDEAGNLYGVTSAGGNNLTACGGGGSTLSSGGGSTSSSSSICQLLQRRCSTSVGARAINRFRSPKRATR